jgi:hypothetical protein
MAQLSPADQEKLNKLIAEGKKLARQLGDELSAASLDNINDDLNTAERLVQGLRDEWKEYTNDVAGTREGFTRIVDEIKNMNSGTKAARSSFSNLASLAQKLQSHQEGINKLSSKEIANLKKQAAERTNDLKLAGKLAKDQIKALEARNNLSNKEQKQLEEARAAHANITQEITENIGFIKQFEDQLDEAGRKAKNMEGALGLAGNATKAISEGLKGLGMGSLSDKLGLDDAQAKMDEMADKITEGGDNAATMGNKFKVMGAGVKSMVSSLGKNLLDPAILVTEFAKALKLVDDGAGDMAKQMNLTYGEALNTRRELGNMAAMSGDVALNTKGLQETYMAVGQSLGTNAKLNEADLKTFTKLREQAGYTNEELAGIQKLSLVNGKTLEANTEEILGGAKAYASRKGFVVNEKEVLKEVSKASASLKLSLGGSAEAVAEAVVKTKEFGLSLEQASKMSESLLNFESSIESELSAELLTGKNLNLETARQLALNNDIAGAAEEIAKQVGTSADFANMNAIQQEAIAKAAGLTKDELAQSLMDREALANLSGVEGKDAKEKFNNLVKQVGMEEAKKRLGNEQLANQFQQQSVQERFAQATEKLQELFIQIAEPVMAIVSPLMNLAGTVLPLINMALQPLIVGFQVVSDTINYILSSVTGLFGMLTGSNEQLSTMQMIVGAIAASYLAYQGYVVATNVYQGISAALSERKLIAENASKISMVAQKVAAVAFLPIQTAIALITGTKAIAEVTAAEAATLGLATIAIVGGLAMVIGAMSSSKSKVNDGVFPAAGGSGYGKRTLMGPEGAIQLNNKDTVIAGTDLFKKGDDTMSGPKGSLSVSNSTAPSPAAPDSNALLVSEMKRGNDLREEQMRKDRTVSTLKIQ